MRKIRFLAVLTSLMAGMLMAAEQVGSAPELVEADLCEILEIPSAVLGESLICPVFVPAELAASERRPALLLLPGDSAELDRLVASWSAGDLPQQDRAVLIVPRIDPDLQPERAFAVVSEVMQLVGERYRIDPARLVLWGLGTAERQAFFAARALPDKFAGIVAPSESVFANRGLLAFALLDRKNQLAAVLSDPATYRGNLANLRLLSGRGLPTRLTDIDQRGWLDICRRVADISARKSSEQCDVVFWIDRLRFAHCGIYQMLGFRNWTLPAGIEGRRVTTGDGAIELHCSTRNVEILSIAVPKDIGAIEIDGNRIECTPGSSICLQFSGRRWKRIEPPALVTSRKHPEAAGPLSDALFTPCVFVVGTLADADLMREWARATAVELGMESVRILSDEEAMAGKEVLEGYSLICFGGAERNRFVAEHFQKSLRDELDLELEGDGVALGYLRPSPFALDRYVVINEIPADAKSPAPARLDWPSDWLLYGSDKGRVLKYGSFDAEWKAEDFPDGDWDLLRP